jgi:hypothetical protein
MPTPPKPADAKKKPAVKKPPATKPASNPFTELHPPRIGRAGAGLSRGSKRGQH